MQDIDFLPAEFRQKTATRHSHGWRAAGMFAVVALLGRRGRRPESAIPPGPRATRRRHGRVRRRRRPNPPAGPVAAALGGRPGRRRTVHLPAPPLAAHPDPRRGARTAARVDHARSRRNPNGRPPPGKPEPRALADPTGGRGRRRRQAAPRHPRPPAVCARRWIPRGRWRRFRARRAGAICCTSTWANWRARRWWPRRNSTRSRASPEQPDAEGKEEAHMRFAATIVIRPGYGQPSGPTGPDHLAQADDTRPANGVPAMTPMPRNSKSGGWIVLVAIGGPCRHLRDGRLPADPHRDRPAEGGDTAEAGLLRPGRRPRTDPRRHPEETGLDAPVHRGVDRHGAARGPSVELCWARSTRWAMPPARDITRFDPEPIVQHDRIATIPVTMGLTGTPSQVFDFLGSLERLPQSIWIENVTIEKEEEKRKMGAL